jgi:WhiB family redox-sensing transcriptional regulator
MKPERREILMQILNEWELKNKSFDWMDDAVCKGTDTSLFFFELGDGQKEMAAAKAVCVTCPVQQECLVFAVDTDLSMVCGAGCPPVNARPGAFKETR